MFNKLAQLVTVALLVLAFPLSALAETFSIEFDFTGANHIETDQPSVQIATEAVDPELHGFVCSVTVVTDNNRSVHLGNDVVVSSNGDQVIAIGVEDGDSNHIEAAGTLTLDSHITVTVNLGPDGIFSARGSVVLDCSPPQTTTTEPSDTTSTTVVETTTTTIPEETTTTEPSDTTSTTVVETTTTVVDTSSTVSSTVPDTLPFTGSHEETGFVALIALIVGTFLILLTRSSKESGI